MNNKNSFWRRTAFVLSFFSTGIPFWLIPYSQVNLPSSLIHPGLAVVVLAALLIRVTRVNLLWKTIRLVGWAPAAAVIARVIVEGIRDPSSHNLWPFEVIIALLLGFACARVGALLGTLIAWMRGGNTITGSQP